MTSTDHRSPAWLEPTELNERVRVGTFATVFLSVYLVFSVISFANMRPFDGFATLISGVAGYAVIRLRPRSKLTSTFHVVLAIIFTQQVACALWKIDTVDLGFLWILALPVLAGVLGRHHHVIVWGIAAHVGLGALALAAPNDHAFWRSTNTLTSMFGVTLTFAMIGYGIYWSRHQHQRGVEQSLAEAQRLIDLREAAEREARDAERQARASENARKRFLATMSHELRTPMAGVILAADGLADHDLTSDERQLVGSIRTAADSLINVLNDVLDLARIDAGELEINRRPSSIRTLVDDVIALLAEPATAHDTELVADLPPDLPDRWNIDPSRLRQMLLNLVTNAIRHAHGSTVVLAVSQRSGELELRVSDNGTGIAPDVLDNIFRPFVQAGDLVEAEAIGFGLGLSIVRDLVTALGGSIDADSEIGVGSTFTVVVPDTAVSTTTVGESATRPDLDGQRFVLDGGGDAARRVVTEWISFWGGTVVDTSDTAAAPLSMGRRVAGRFPFQSIESLAHLIEGAPEPSTNPRPAGHTIEDATCLVVDDDETVRIVLKAVFERVGYRVVDASDGHAALEVLATEPIDFVFLDLSMPGMNGLDCLRRIRSLDQPLSATPVCIISGTALPRDDLIEIGADDFVQKPSRATELIDVAQRLAVTASQRLEAHNH